MMTTPPSQQPVLPETIFYDIFDYEYLPLWKQYPWTLGIISVLILASIVILCIWLMRKRRQLTAETWALQTLESLKTQKSRSHKEYKKLYFDLTNTIKLYLHKQFLWKTLDKTDDELLIYLALQGISNEHIATIAKLMNGALHIKFANQSTQEEQALNDIATCEQFIRSMKLMYDQQQKAAQAS